MIHPERFDVHSSLDIGNLNEVGEGVFNSGMSLSEYVSMFFQSTLVAGGILSIFGVLAFLAIAGSAVGKFKG